MESIQRRFASDQQVHAQRWWDVQGRVPRRLYHYTTVDGMVGIITSGALWASDVRFMNDSSELRYAASLIESVIGEVFNEVAGGELSEALPNRDGFANGFEFGARPFIACFCEKADLLSQWRAYGIGQAPVSLGLDLHFLALSKSLPPNTFLRKVVYDETTQRKTVRAVVETWLSTIESITGAEGGPSLGDVLPYPGIWALQQALAEHHLSYKHPSFEEEQEWRLIKLVDVRQEFRLLDDRRRDEMVAATRQRMQALGVGTPEHSTAWASANAEGVQIAFRSSPLGLVPYVELPLRDPAGVFTGRLPLWHVVQGPSSHPDLAMDALAMFLESRGYGFHTEVEASGVPLRS